MSREEEMTAASANAIAEIAEALKLEPSNDSVVPLMRAAVGGDKLTVYELALHCAQEADLCLKQDAYLSGCLMGSAAVEAFLTLNCLQEQEEVERSLLYRSVKKRSKSYRDTVADLTFDKLIKLSNELGWISLDVVNAEVFSSLLVDLPQVAKTVYPKLSHLDIQARTSALTNSPGPEMLLLLRDLRNLVHPPRWSKTETVLDKAEFRLNCRLAMTISAELILCFSHRVAKMSERTLAQLESFHKLPEPVKDHVRKQLLIKLGNNESV